MANFRAISKVRNIKSSAFHISKQKATKIKQSQSETSTYSIPLNAGEW